MKRSCLRQEMNERFIVMSEVLDEKMLQRDMHYVEMVSKVAKMEEQIIEQSAELHAFTGSYTPTSQ